MSLPFLFELVLSPLPFLFEPRPRFMRFNFPQLSPLLSSLNHVLDSCYTTFPLHFIFEPRPRFMLYTTFPTTFPHLQRQRRRRGRRPSCATAGWKVNNSIGSAFPPSPTTTALTLLPFPVDRSCWLFEQQRGGRERPTKACLYLERARECEESNYKR